MALSSCLGRLTHRIERWLKNESAVLTVEAAIVLPISASLFLVGISVARTAMAELALEAALADTVKTVAVHSYPIKVALDEFSKTAAGQSITTWLEQAQKAHGLLDDYRSYIPGDLFRMFTVRGRDELYEAVADFVWDRADKRILRRSSLRVTFIEIPDFLGQREPYLTIAAEYEFRPLLPFASYRIVVRERVSERCWVGA